MKANLKYGALSAVTAVSVMIMSLGALSFAQSATVTCAPAVQNVTLGQTASVNASGGDGKYIWSAPDLTIANPTGSGFSANYATIGTHTLTVTSGGNAATCSINVLASGTTTPPPTTTPGLPDTGGGYGK